MEWAGALLGFVILEALSVFSLVLDGRRLEDNVTEFLAFFVVFGDRVVVDIVSLEVDIVSLEVSRLGCCAPRMRTRVRGGWRNNVVRCTFSKFDVYTNSILREVALVCEADFVP